MTSKIKRYSLLLFASLTGLVVGYFRPEVSQPLLSVTGVIVGIGFFILSKRDATGKSAQHKKKESANQMDWYLLLQMLLYFIVGTAIGVTIFYMVVLY